MNRTYWQRVKEHPGVGIASAMTAFGFIAGIQHGSVKRALVGAAVMAVFCWGCVLITARSQPHDR
jgi:hypothetical protein